MVGTKQAKEGDFGASAHLGRRRGLSVALVKVRWFGVAFAFFQIVTGTDPTCAPATIIAVDCEPIYLRPYGYALAAGLAIANLMLTLWLRRYRTLDQLRRAGLAMFIVDHLFLIAFTWLYSFTETTTIWIILYILPLEGALRYAMRGALSSLGMLFAAEIARDFWREAIWGFEFQLVPDTSFRLGILTIIGLVAGIMARNLERERLEVERRAENEASARAELEVLYEATLAGVSTDDFQKSMQNIVTTIGSRFGFESLALGLIEEGTEEVRLRVVAGYRYPKDAIGKSITLDQGISGPVAREGKPIIVNDVSEHPGYLDWAPRTQSGDQTGTQSEMVAPLVLGENTIGVLNVESSRRNAFTESDLEALCRLAVPVAVVVHNARILVKEKEAVERLTELDRMKSDFIAITSHELRTPLTSIRGFVQTINRPDLDLEKEDLGSYLEVIDRQSQRLQVLIEDLLFITQLEAGVIEVHLQQVDLCGLIREVVKEDFPQDEGRVKIDAAPNQCTATSDRGRLRRVISNLIDNSVKFSPPNAPITVSVRMRPSHVEISFQDEGIGIPTEEQSRIFDRFHQVGGSMNRPHQGSGLGLYICRRVMQALGGEVSVRSSPGRGSTFSLTLPQQEIQSPEASVAEVS